MISRQSLRKVRLGVEALEGREVPAVDFTLSGTTLSIFQVGFIGKADTVNITDDGKGGIKVEANYKTGFATKDFSGIGAINKINLNLKGGNDKVGYTLTGSPTTGAQALEIVADLGTQNDTFKADMGNQTLRANRTFTVDGKADNDTLSLVNVGDVGAAEVSGANPQPAVTPTLKADFKGVGGKDSADVKLVGAIYGTVEVTWDGGGDFSGFFPNQKAIDNFKFEATTVNIKKTGSLKVTSDRSNADVTHSGFVSGTAAFSVTGGNKNDILKLNISVSPNENQGLSNEVAGGTVSAKVDGGAGKDDVSLLIKNAASFANTNKPVGFTLATLDGGAGNDKGTASSSTASFIQVTSVEQLTNV